MTKIFKISKFVYQESDIFLKIGFTEIPYINKGLLVYLVFSMGMGVNIPCSKKKLKFKSFKKFENLKIKQNI
jgi:hypothetical protein